MDAYLLETTTLSALLDSGHVKHVDAYRTIAALDEQSSKYVSVIALAELKFGQHLIEAFTQQSPENIAEVICQTQRYPLLEVTKHTAAQYGELKAILAQKYLAKALRGNRPRWLENWIDKATGQTLQVDENDLWMCAQARERNLVLLTADKKLTRVSTADPAVRLQVI